VKIPDFTAGPVVAPETRVLEDGCVLLSKDGKPLAAVRVREAGDTSEVLLLDAAKAALAQPKVGNESVFEKHFKGADILVQTRIVTQGARLLVVPQRKRSKKCIPVSDEPAAALEVAAQVFPESNGAALKLAFVNGEAAAKPDVFRARAISF